MHRLNNRILVEGSLAVALSVVFSAIRLWTMPQGGSITLEMVPLFLFALRRGWRAGMAAGAVSGVLQLLTGGYVVHPIQALLDYPMAFAVLGAAGAVPLRRPLWVGMAVGGALRFLCHLASGVIFFASFAPKGSNVLLYSAVYNGSFLLPALAVSVAVTCLLWPRLQKIPEGRE